MLPRCAVPLCFCLLAFVCCFLCFISSPRCCLALCSVVPAIVLLMCPHFCAMTCSRTKDGEVNPAFSAPMIMSYTYLFLKLWRDALRVQHDNRGGLGCQSLDTPRPASVFTGPMSFLLIPSFLSSPSNLTQQDRTKFLSQNSSLILYLTSSLRTTRAQDPTAEQENSVGEG